MSTAATPPPRVHTRMGSVTYSSARCARAVITRRISLVIGTAHATWPAAQYGVGRGAYTTAAGSGHVARSQDNDGRNASWHRLAGLLAQSHYRACGRPKLTWSQSVLSQTARRKLWLGRANGRKSTSAAIFIVVPKRGIYLNANSDPSACHGTG